MMRAVFGMGQHLIPFFFSPNDLAELQEYVEIDTSRAIASIEELDPAERPGVDTLITAWGGPEITADVLEKLPGLRAIVHAAGTVRFVDPEAWRRGIVVSSGAWANAVPVAEFAVAMITLAGKDAFWVARTYAREQREIFREAELPAIGNYGRTVGIVGASRIGSRVIRMLQAYDMRVLVFDPFCTEEQARLLGAELVSDLSELARRSTILSIHAPSRPETWGMISREVLAALPDDATVINTARADIVDQEALIAELRSGRLRAVLDVTEPEVLPKGHILYTLPNVYLTPHLAGAAGNELRRLGESAVAEVRRHALGEPLKYAVEVAELARMA
ncbi:MAG TPA: hydroxyacid dehydrogenase [Leifsonia sp.]|nr:hydroxyacid dehydrogenase [Leifsonia sp.]